MHLIQPADLSGLNTFAVAASAGGLFVIESEEDVLALPPVEPDRDLVLSGGSNILFVSDVPGSVYLNRIRGLAVVDVTPDHFLVEVGAGENWHQLVTTAVERGWHGLENLALIPGLAGAAPIQNIGAYGVELASVLESVTAWDWHSARWTSLTTEQCRLAYRDSLFRSGQPGRYLITSIRLRLARRFTPYLDYSGLRDRVSARSAGPTAAAVCAAVIQLRREKLPDPSVQGNAGSFFKNPVIDPARLDDLLAQGPQLAHWQTPGGVKVSAASLIEHCGLKGLRHDGAAVSGQHALVLVNEGCATGASIWRLACQVRQRVEDRFGVRLEPEPRIYGSAAGA